MNITDQVVYGLYENMKKYEAAASSFPEGHKPTVPNSISIRFTDVTELDRYIFQMSLIDREWILMGLSAYITESLGKKDVDVCIVAGLPYRSEINVRLNQDYFVRA